MKRRYLKVVWCTLLCVGIAISARALAVHRQRSPARAFGLRYATTVTNLPEAARQVRVWIPLAKTRDNQRISSRHITNETVTRLAQDATASQASDSAKARALYDYVIGHMIYDKTTPGWGRGDTVRACQLGRGNCTDFHSLFISMARAIGIPARFVMGLPLPQEAEGMIPGYHCWTEFHHPSAGWVPIDASEAWKHPELRDYYFGTQDPHRFLVSIGRNIQLVPPQAGPPVNIFIYPYVEVDGQPCGSVETRFVFKDKHKEGRT